MPTLLENPLIDTLQLASERTAVPASLVHKRLPENVLLTELRADSDTRFMCSGRIPAAHGFFNDAGRTPQKDILFYTELGRQASLAASHRFLGVSQEDVFIFEQSHASITEAALKLKVQPELDSVITEIRVHELETRKNNVVNRVVAEHLMFIGGEEVFRGTGHWTIQPAALFKRLRRMAKRPEAQASIPRAAAPLNAGLRRNHFDNGVIVMADCDDSRTEFSAALAVDQTHPYFFDHPCDHVPGMLILEGCAQLAKVVAADCVGSSIPQNFEITAYDMNFQQFVECDVPVLLTARLDAADVAAQALLPAVHISLAQQDVICGTAALTVALAI